MLFACVASCTDPRIGTSVLTGGVVPASCFTHRGLLGFQRLIWQFVPRSPAVALNFSKLTSTVPEFSPARNLRQFDSRVELIHYENAESKFNLSNL